MTEMAGIQKSESEKGPEARKGRLILRAWSDTNEYARGRGPVYKWLRLASREQPYCRMC